MFVVQAITTERQTMIQSLEKIRALKLNGMALALEEQLQSPHIQALGFEERISLLIDREETYRSNRRYQARLRTARLKDAGARIEDCDILPGRGLDKPTIVRLSSCQWIRCKQNLFVTGPTGVGKTFVACALGHRACIEGLSVRYCRWSRLMQDFAIARATSKLPGLLDSLAKIDLLILDDWGIGPLGLEERSDLLELLEDRYNAKSTAIVSQLPVDRWHELIGDPSMADAILDRLVHAAHRVEMKGPSQRKVRSSLTSAGVEG